MPERSRFGVDTYLDSTHPDFRKQLHHAFALAHDYQLDYLEAGEAQEIGIGLWQLRGLILEAKKHKKLNISKLKRLTRALV